MAFQTVCSSSKYKVQENLSQSASALSSSSFSSSSTSSCCEKTKSSLTCSFLLPEPTHPLDYARVVFVGESHIKEIIKNMENLTGKKSEKSEHATLYSIQKIASEKQKERLHCIKIADRIFIFVGTKDGQDKEKELSAIAAHKKLEGKYIVFWTGMERNPEVEQKMCLKYKISCYGIEDPKMSLLKYAACNLIRAAKLEKHLDKEKFKNNVYEFMTGFSATSLQIEVFEKVAQDVKNSQNKPSYEKVVGLVRHFLSEEKSSENEKKMEEMTMKVWVEFLKAIAIETYQRAKDSIGPYEQVYIQAVLNQPLLNNKNFSKFAQLINQRLRDPLIARNLFSV